MPLPDATIRVDSTPVTYNTLRTTRQTPTTPAPSGTASASIPRCPWPWLVLNCAVRSHRHVCRKSANQRRQSWGRRARARMPFSPCIRCASVQRLSHDGCSSQCGSGGNPSRRHHPHCLAPGVGPVDSIHMCALFAPGGAVPVTAMRRSGCWGRRGGMVSHIRTDSV